MLFNKLRTQMKWIIIVVAVAFGGGLLYVGGESFFGGGAQSAQAIARVNRDTITDFELHQAYVSLLTIRQQTGQTTSRLEEEELRFTALDQLITEKLMLQAAKRERIRVSEAEVRAQLNEIKSDLGDYYATALRQQGLNEQILKDLIRQTLTLQKVQEEKSAVELTDEELRQAFEEQFQRREVRHILLEASVVDGERDFETALARAEEVAAQLEAGADFAEMAAAYSDDTVTAVDGGNLGVISRQHPFVEEFLEAAFALEVGRVSEPVRSPFGYHLIEVTEATVVDPPEGETYEEVADDFRRYVITERGSGNFRAWINEEKENATIAITDPRLSAYQLVRMGHLDQAIAHYEDALEANPDDPYLMFHLAQVLQRVDAVDAAIDMFHQAAERGGADPMLWYALGNAYKEAARDEEAKDALVNASTFSQGDPQFRAPLAQMFEDMGYDELAEAEWAELERMQNEMIEQFLRQQEAMQQLESESQGLSADDDAFTELERALQEQLQSDDE